MVRVELVYVAKDKTTLHLKMDLHEGATVADALASSEIYELYPETRDLPVGIYAKQLPLDTPLHEGDRIELYRPLVRDPKEKRRALARARK